jgi:DNA-binding IclR family transcriptional regulator
MTNAAIPEDIRKFLDDYITSLTQLEMLLLLHKHPEQEWSAQDVSRSLYLQPEAAATRLDDLVRHGVVTVNDSMDRRYHYDPAIGVLDATVTRLARVYKERRVSVITLIFSKPLESS